MLTTKAWFPICFYLLLVSLILIPQEVVGHPPTIIDSLKQQLSKVVSPIEKGDLLLQIATRYKTKDPEQAIQYLNQAAAIPEFSNHPKKKLKISFLYGVAIESQHQFDSAKTIFKDLLEAQRPIMTDTSLVADIFYRLGNIGRLEGQVDQAIEHFNSAKEFYFAQEDSLGIAVVDVSLGIIYKKTEQFEKAIQFYQSAYTIFETYQLTENMATCIMNMANVRNRQKRYGEAIELFEQALEISNSLDLNENLQAFIYGNISNLHSEQQNHKEALTYALRSYQLRKDIARPHEKATILIGIANNLENLKRFSEAENYANQALEIANSADGMLEVKERLYKLKYKLNLSTNEPRAALEAVQQYLIFHDSVRSTELEKQALDLNTKYETEKKEQEIALLNAENKLADTQLKASRRQTYGLLFGLLILGGLLFGIAGLYNKTQQQNKVITKALAEKEILLREIHHRVKNNMQFVSSLLGLQTEHVQDETVLSALQEGQDRVQSMALIHQNLYQDKNLTGVAVKDYFVKLIRNLFDSYNIQPDQVKLQLEIPDVTLELDSVTPIGLVVNELVSNSLKYAFPKNRPGTIKVGLKEKTEYLELTVKDDGIGMSNLAKETLGTSFGYRLIEVFKDQLHANLFIDNTNGTQVNMEIKKYKKIKEENYV